jgi:SAM-dependent methyltransferase
MPDLQEQFGQIDIYLFDQLLRGRIRPGMRVLDTGCGSGRNLVYFLREGYEVFGVDTDPNAIECTRGLAASLAPAVPADNFRVEAIEEMTFPDAFADLVLTSAVLHFARRDDHFEAMLRATWRVLKPGGLFFCRLASSIGMEHQVQRVSGRRFRSEVSFRCSIQRESCTSGANARSASVVGNGPGSLFVRTNRSRAGPPFWPGSTGSQRDQGASAGSNTTLRGPVRRS